MIAEQRQQQLFQFLTALIGHSDNPFKIRAFQNAARAIASVPESLDTLLETPGRLEQVKGIGKSSE